MIRVTIEVDQYGHDFRIVREDERMGDGVVSEKLERLVKSAHTAMHAALTTAPTE